MKQAARILSLFLVILLLLATLTACAKPAKTPEKASAALKKAGYVVVLDTRVLPGIFSGLGYDLTTVLSASKTVTDSDGNKTVEHLTVFYFDSKQDAKDALEEIEKYALDDKDAESTNSDWIETKRRGSMVYYGTKKALKASH